MADWRVGRVDHPRRRARRRGRGLLGVPARPLPLRARPARRDWVDEEGNDLGHGEYRERAVLSDGGVYDNLGLETAWKACRTRARLRRRRPDGGRARPRPRLGPPPVPRARRDRQPGPLAAQAPVRRRVPRRRAARAPTGASAATSPTSASTTRCRRRTPRRSRWRRSRRGSRGSTSDVQERAHQLGLRGLRRRAARARRPGAARAGRLPLSRGGDRRREARAAPAGAVGVRPRASCAATRRTRRSCPTSGWRTATPSPTSALDLLLEPHRDAGAAALALALQHDAADRRRGRSMRLAYNQSHVAAELTFEELVRGVLPLSRWWRDYLWPPGTDDVRRGARPSAGARSSPASRTRCASRAGARSATSCPAR